MLSLELSVVFFCGLLVSSGGFRSPRFSTITPELILNGFLAGSTISAGMAEGFNNKVKMTMRNSCGRCSKNAIEKALYHKFGNLTEPNLIHRFC